MKESKKQKKDDQSIKALLSLFRNNWLRFTTIFTTMALSSVFGASLPYFIGKIASLAGESGVDFGQLKTLLFAMVGVSIAHQVFWSIGGVLNIYWQTPIFYEYRKILQRSTWDFEYKNFIDRPSGKVASAVNESYRGLGTIFLEFVRDDIEMVVSFPVFIGILFISSKENAVLFSVFLIILGVVSMISLNKVRRTAKVHSDMQSTVMGKMFDSFSNFVNVKSFKSEPLEMRSLGLDNKKQLKTSIDRSVADELYWLYADLVIRWGLWISFAILNLWLYKNNRLDIAGIVTAVAVLQQFTNSVWTIAERAKSITTNFSEYKQNYNYLFPGRNVVKEYYQDLNKPKLKVQKPIFDSSISFNNLNFAYPDRDDTKVLKNINLTINKNEKVGIVGKSGSGKTTLIKLLLGFYDYEDGAIQVDGKPLKKESLGLLNSYVPQDTTLFQQSIAYNIAYAKNGKATKKEIIAAAKKAHAHEFINSLPDKYETLVGERGIKLSLGQRQRIAIARAFLKHSDLLILDEATSALDSKTEKLVQDSLEKLWKDKTVVAIAHRLSTLNNVNRIIVMDAGRIVESGTKAELLSQNGIFTDLWKHQKDGLIID